MISGRIKQKIKNLLSYLANNNAFISPRLQRLRMHGGQVIFSLFILILTISIWLFFPVSSSGIHYYSLGLYILLFIAIIIFTSYKKDISIPIAKTVLKKEHTRIKSKQKQKNKKGIITKTYLKILHYLVLLFKNSQDSFEDLREDIFDEFSKLMEGVKGNKKSKKKEQSIIVRTCLKTIRYLVLLSKSFQNNFDISEDDTLEEMNKIFEKSRKKKKTEDKFKGIRQTIEKMQTGKDVDQTSLEELDKELFEFSKFK